MKIYIYQIVCTENNKRYIGRTKNLKSRFGNHKYDLLHGRHYNSYLQEDFNKYGLNSFSFESIEVVNDNLASLREDYWIDYYGGIESDSTYNYQNNITKNKEYSKIISNSKQGTIPWNKGRKMSPKEVEVNSKSHIGIKRSKESIEKQQQSIANNPNFGNRGKHLSEETKKKISESNRGRQSPFKGKTKYTPELVLDLKSDLESGKSYEYIIEKHKPEFNLDRHFINKLIKHNGPPYMKNK